MTNSIKFIFINIAIFIFASCTISHNYGPYIGKVVDAETGEPIAGAGVHIRFYTIMPDPGGGSSSYAGSIECLTDKNGEFNLSYYAKKIKLFSFWDNDPIIVIFKPGYGTYPRYQGTTITPNPEFSNIEENQYCVIRLPKLNSDEDRTVSLGKLFLGSIPLEDQRIMKKLENQERVYLGFKPHRLPNASNMEP